MPLYVESFNVQSSLPALDVVRLLDRCNARRLDGVVLMSIIKVAAASSLACCWSLLPAPTPHSPLLGTEGLCCCRDEEDELRICPA